MNFLKLAYLNMSRRKSQTLLIGLIIIITIMSFLIFSTINDLITIGIENSSDRLGADLIIVPNDTSLDTEELLFTGTPDSSYLDSNLFHKFKQIEDIEYITAQFYTATIEGADCCGPDVSLRLVGIDMESDFILRSWFSQHKIKTLEGNQIVVGRDVPMFLGSKIALLGEIFEVVGTLDKTGTGMDETIFLDINKARELSSEKFSNLWTSKNPDDSLSTILIKAKPNTDINQLSNDIKSINDNIKVSKVSDSVAKVKTQFFGIKKLINYIIISLILVSFISLLALYDNLIKNRRKEIGYLRGLGLSKLDILKLLKYEIFLISIIFGSIGAICGSLLIQPILNIVKTTIIVPAASLTNYILIQRIFLAILFSLLLGTIASFNSIRKIYKLDPQKIMSEGGIY